MTARVIHTPEQLRFIGRWMLPSGRTIRVVRIDQNSMALVGNGQERWYMTVKDLTMMVESPGTRFLGR